MRACVVVLRVVVGREFRPPQFSSPREAWFGEISIHLYMLFKFYIENEDSDYPQNRWITIASYGTAVTPFFDKSRRNMGRKLIRWVLPLV